MVNKEIECVDKDDGNDDGANKNSEVIGLFDANDSVKNCQRRSC